MPKQPMCKLSCTFKKIHDRRIPKVGVDVGVGPMEFQLNSRDDWAHLRTRVPVSDKIDLQTLIKA